MTTDERRRLDSWKEIARYLDRDVTTVRRWEKKEGLPVHRHLHHTLGSVYAYSDEVDAWWQQRSTVLLAVPPLVPPPAPPPVNGKAGFGAATSLLAVVVLIVATLGGVWWMTWWRESRPPVVPIAVIPPDGTVVDSIALSPDGKQIVFAAINAPGSALWIRRLDSAASQMLSGTLGATLPFWSPDGAGIGFFAGGRLKRIAVATQNVIDLAPAPDPRGGTWNDRGDIVFAPDEPSALLLVPASGGSVKPVTTLGGHAPREGHAWPEFLPDGRHVLYTDVASDAGRRGIWVADVVSGRARRVLPVRSSAVYSPDGYLLYGRDPLVAHTFDPATLTVTGTPVVVAPRVLQRLAERVDVSVSRTGLIAVRTAAAEENRLVLVDRSGRELHEIGPAGYYSNPALSPDGRHVAATVTHDPEHDELWLFDVASGAASPLTTGGAWDGAPLWSSEGSRLMFLSLRDKSVRLVERMLARGTDEPVPSAPPMESLESWSHDGKYLTYQTRRPATRFDIEAWRPDGEHPSFPVIATAANEGQSRLSRDGRFMAYVSDKSGHFEVYVTTFPDAREEWRVSPAGGFDPRWRGDGVELYYIAADRRMMAVEVSTVPTFRAGVASPLFKTQFEFLWQDTRNHYDVTADGQRFVVIRPVERRTAPFTLLVNWHR